MITLVMAVLAVFGAVLPDASSVPGISGEAVVAGATINGFGWLRILETEYSVLRVSSDPAVPMTAYDDGGEPMAVSTDGSPLVLSAYSDYWFWVKASSTEDVVFTVEYLEPSLITGGSVSSSLSAAEMAKIWSFSPESSGKWNFFLSGADELADLDLEIYSEDNTLWAGSYGVTSSEKLTFNLLAGEEVQVVVSRYNKGGSGDYTLEMTRAGDFPVLGEKLTSDASPGNVHRYLLPELNGETLLELTFTGEGDLDMYVTDSHGETIYSAATYFSSECVLLSPGDSPTIVEVFPFQIDTEAESFPFELSLGGVRGMLSPGRKYIAETAFGESHLLGFTPEESGLYTFSGVFDKLRDGDLRLFDGFGEPAVVMNTPRGDESFCFWVSGGDTVWLAPSFMSPGMAGSFDLFVTESETTPVAGLVRGRVDDTTPGTVYYSVNGQAGTTLVIELRGDQRSFDLDMLVSGPGYALQAQGGLSNSDNAADESVTLHCREDGLYGITVYAYTPGEEGTYRLSAERIPTEDIPPGTPAPETWAVIVGISGYGSMEDILFRASMDAIDMYRFLRDEQGVDPGRMILLVDAEATSEAFTGSVRSLSERAGPEDRLVIFFSGHGSQEAPGSGGPEEADGVNEVLCFYDEDLSDDALAELLRGFPGGVLLFADACNSGGLVNDFRPGDNVLVVTAAREDRSVSERILTPVLLEASRGAADTDGNGIVTAGELVEYVDGMLARICPVCDAVVNERMAECPECGTVLKGEYRIPRPEQGLFMPGDTEVWNQER